MNPNQKLIITLCISAFIGVILSPASYAAGSSTKEKHQKVIDFEDELVEGMNKRPLDSLSQISEKDKKRKKSHLYRKRVSFNSENQQLLNEARYNP